MSLLQLIVLSTLLTVGGYWFLWMADWRVCVGALLLSASDYAAKMAMPHAKRAYLNLVRQFKGRRTPKL